MAGRKFKFPNEKAPLIDVHFHHFPPVLRDLGEFTIASPDETDHAMELLKTTAVILSPVLWSKYNTNWSRKQWTQLCRDLTDAQAAEVRNNPTTRGSFAPLPLPHVQETLEAIKYCEEECSPRADGYAITTSANNYYLGDPIFDPIWEECNHRGLVLFVHPSETVNPPLDTSHYQFPMIEYPTETARCLMTMVDNGTFTKYPDIKWIFSHNGGSFPFLFQRVIHNNAGRTLQEIFRQGNAYFECSQGTSTQQGVLRSMGVPPSRILTGSDWPFTGKVEVESTLAEMNGPESSGLFNAEELEGIRAGNFLAIAPRLAEAWVQSGLVQYKREI
ncbi:hypothetical protein FOXB_13507 [Fusarium oxysporum f. sp. conglutinans Fo5176]|uniref:Amidohydrolase-related domain-containing protein n=1 Tax=Fusarium oxysporum (strain Fo5176) TaxID=660025 RepID=F9G4C5_FUSOF|nr:hypothetical protein FOXB_13507 [Fusarium oxysporum f. sp. conglutinans Fo5176]